MRDTRPQRTVQASKSQVQLGRTRLAPNDPASPRDRGAYKRDGRRWGCASIVLLLVVLVNVGATLMLGSYFLRDRSQAVMAAATANPNPGPGAATQTLDLTDDDAPSPTSDPLPPLPTGTVYMLLLGVDARPDELDKPVRTDTMMVARIDFDNHTVRLLSLPRDLWLAMPADVQERGVAVGRINQGYFYGELYDLPGGGPQGAMDTVTLNFGIPLHGYVLVNFQGFVDVVDALGGIDVDVPKPIYDASFPTEDYGTIVFELPAGPQHMDGLTTLRYVRTRHQDNDFRRIERQQQVLLAVRAAALDVDVVTKAPDLWAAVSENFRTSLTLEQMIAYGLAGQQIPREDITTFAIEQTMLIPWKTPGGANVWIPKRDQIAPLIEEFMRE